MEIVTALAKLLLLPPFGFFVLIVVGWLVMRRHRRLGRALFAAGLVALYLFSTPHIGSSLLRGLQVDQPLPLNPSVQDVGAIVVLGADVRRQPPEFGGDTVGALTLERIRYGAKLYRELGLPLLVTGGATRPRNIRSGSPCAKAWSRILSCRSGGPKRRQSIHMKTPNLAPIY